MRVSSQVKRGRPSHKGKNYGYNTDAAIKEKILVGYRRECGLGVPMSEIYTQSMIKDFGCKVRPVKRGKKEHLEIWHPMGKPFPQPGTFEYHIVRNLGREAISTTLMGKVRARSKIMPTRGPFSEHIWNLMQCTETDAYAVTELARGLIEGLPLPPLYVTTRRDTASGIKTGIGFSQGSERSSAYRMAKFCEAIDKVKFCWLFGIVITADRWPSIGLSPADIQDRGPGSTPGADAREEEFGPVFSGMPPSHSGQSKANAESSNPRTRHNNEAPNYFQSQLRTFELIRREIFNLFKFNETNNVRNRIPPDLADTLKRETPNALWEALDSLGRNDAVLMSFEDAVRTFLDKRTAKLSRDGVRLHGQLYKSAALSATDACATVTGRSDLPIEIFFLDGCIRHIWMDWKGQLIELDLTFPVPVQNEILYMSMSELEQYEKFCKECDLEHEEHRSAVALQIYDEFHKSVGHEWNSGSLKSGRAKRGSRAAKQEAAEARHTTDGKEPA